MALEQDYTFYFAQLAFLKNMADPTCEDPGRPPEVTPGRPQAGYYRTRHNEAVVIWHREDGKAFAQKANREKVLGLIRDDAAIDALFGEVCRHPIDGDTYTRFIDTATWPEDVEKPPVERGIGDNSAALAPHERVRAEIANFLDTARSWLKSIGGKVKTKEQVDRAANYSEEFAKLERKADEEQKRLKKPILDAGREIDRAWKPVIAEASDAKREFKRACEEYLIEIKRKAQEQERRDREEAAAKGELVQHRPSAAVAGTGGARVSLRTVKMLVVTDMKAVAQFYLSMDALPVEIAEAIQVCAKRALEGGAQIPGCELKTEQRAA